MRILNAREREALERLAFDPAGFTVKGELPVGIGETTLQSLLDLGLLETGQGTRHSDMTGYRVTPDGWRVMYGKTHADIMALGAGQSHPLKVWSWPPSS